MFVPLAGASAAVHAVPGADAKVGGNTAINLDVAHACTHDRNLLTSASLPNAAAITPARPARRRRICRLAGHRKHAAYLPVVKGNQCTPALRQQLPALPWRQVPLAVSELRRVLRRKFGILPGSWGLT